MSHIRNEYLKETTMTKKYRLLKDLPGYEAGTVFHKVTEADKQTHLILTPDNISYIAEDYPDWFAPLPDDEGTPGRWRAGVGQDYWITDSTGEVITVAESNDLSDQYHYDIGNYFRTETQAEAAAEAIRAVLGYIQTPTEDDSGEYFSLRTAITDKAYEARKLIQENS